MTIGILLRGKKFAGIGHSDSIWYMWREKIRSAQRAWRRSSEGSAKWTEFITEGLYVLAAAKASVGILCLTFPCRKYSKKGAQLYCIPVCIEGHLLREFDRARFSLASESKALACLPFSAAACLHRRGSAQQSELWENELWANLVDWPLAGVPRPQWPTKMQDTSISISITILDSRTLSAWAIYDIRSLCDRAFCSNYSNFWNIDMMTVLRILAHFALNGGYL